MVSVKPSLADYSWDELSILSEKISNASSRDSALSIARQYNLVNSSGTLDGTQVKAVTLTNGVMCKAMLVGIDQDVYPDGTKGVGLTFMLSGSVNAQGMNDSSNSGGWESSSMRSWISSEGMMLLPSDLRSDVVSVRKWSNSNDVTTGSPEIVTTKDKLWLFSTSEIVGTNIDWSQDYPFENDTLNSEGSQYQLFSAIGVTKDNTNNPILVEPMLESAGGIEQGAICSWWTRSSTSFNATDFYSVSPDGDPRYNQNASSACGVVLGFCI